MNTDNVERTALSEKATLLANLTLSENIVLNRLEMEKGQIVSKTELTFSLYGDGASRDSNTIEVFVGRLRRKLDGKVKMKIETIRGWGYRLEDEHA